MNPDPKKTEFEAAYEAGMRNKALDRADFYVGQGERPLALVPQGFTVHDLSKYLDAPVRIEANAQFKAVGSFIYYLNEYKNTATLLCCDRDTATFQAHLDYHGKGEPSHRTHTAKLSLKASEEWQAWQRHNEQSIDQATLAEFLDDQIAVISEPAATDILSAVKHFEAKREVTYSRKNDDLGNAVVLNYVDDQRGTGKVTVPTAFTLVIPVFEHGAPVKIEARLRWTLKEDKLIFNFKLERMREVYKQAFEAVVSEIEKGTGLTALHGSV